MNVQITKPHVVKAETRVGGKGGPELSLKLTEGGNYQIYSGSMSDIITITAEDMNLIITELYPAIQETLEASREGSQK